MRRALLIQNEESCRRRKPVPQVLYTPHPSFSPFSNATLPPVTNNIVREKLAHSTTNIIVIAIRLCVA